MDGRLMFDKVRGHFSTVALSAISFHILHGPYGSIESSPQKCSLTSFQAWWHWHAKLIQLHYSSPWQFCTFIWWLTKVKTIQLKWWLFHWIWSRNFFDNKASFCLLIEKALWNCKGVPEDRLFLRNCPTRRFSQSICCNGDIWSGFGWSSVAVVESSSSRFSSSPLKYWWNERRSCFYSPYHQQSIC